MNNIWFDIADEMIKNVKKADDFSKIEHQGKHYKVSKIELFENNSYNREKGKYYSLYYENLEEEKIYKSVKNELIKLIDELLEKKYKRFLIVGIGNEDFAPDSLGPRVVKKMKATYHLNTNNSKVACIIPGVMALTGLESASIVKGIINENKIDCVIVIDSLATTSIDRLNHVIQITDTGLQPGSGINNYRKGINEDYLGCKVVSLGVGTVISLNALINNFSRVKLKEHYENIILTTKEIEIKIDLITDLISSSLNKLLNPSI